MSERKQETRFEQFVKFILFQLTFETIFISYLLCFTETKSAVQEFIATRVIVR